MVKLRYSSKSSELIWMLVYRYKGEEVCIGFYESRSDACIEAGGLEPEDLQECFVARCEMQMDEGATKSANAGQERLEAATSELADRYVGRAGLPMKERK